MLIAASPGVVEKFKPWLEAPAKRIITVGLQVYEPTEIGGVEIVPFQHNQTDDQPQARQLVNYCASSFYT